MDDAHPTDASLLARMAHRDPKAMGNTLKAYLLRYLRELRHVPIADLLDARYRKFRAMGVFDEGPAAGGDGGAAANGVAPP